MNNNISQLRALLLPPGGCGCCPLSDAQLNALLLQYPNIRDAAYHACIMLSRDTSLSLPDGMSIPDQSAYWLRLARMFRDNASRTVGRADEEAISDD